MAIGIGIGLTFGRRKGIDAQAQAAFNSLQSAGFTTPQGIMGINAAFKTIKTIYGTSDITTAISFFGDPSLAYQIGAGSGTTLGQAIRTLPNIIDPTRATDAVQTTAASQPLLLVHSGVNYWWGSGIVGNHISTPQSTANQITGDIDIIAYINPNGLKNQKCITGSGGTGNPNYLLSLNSNRKLEFWSFGGYGSFAISDTLSTNNQWVRATRNISTGQVIFYTSNDIVTTNINSINWVQLGSPVTYANTGTFTTSQLWVGNFPPYPNDNGFEGAIYRVTISNSIGGAPVVDFNPNQYNPSTSQTQWTSSTGEVWSIQTGTAATGYKGQLVTKTIVMGDGVDDTLISGVLTSKQFFSQHIALNPLNIPASGGGYYVDGGGANGLIFGNAESIKAFNGSELDFIGDLEYRLQYVQADFNNTTSNLYLNNSNNVSGSTGTRTTTRVVLFSNGSGGSFGNAIISTIISGTTIDTSTQRTGVYNYVRSLNGSAF